jgi:hypothetical protein
VVGARRPLSDGIIEETFAVPLTTHAPIAFIPTLDAKAARAFYEDTLGLNFEFHLQPLVG